ncbi:MAG: LacI family DNA-binding transcriptional regulator [Burkholderiaceae bacterium]
MDRVQQPSSLMGRPGTVKLIDVARMAGVSLATASRALSSPDLVRGRTRHLVEEAAARLGYVPHGAARALASQRTRTIGAVFPPLENPIFATGTHALGQELERAGYTLLLAEHDNDPAVELRVARRLIERGVDGLVLIGLAHDPALFELLTLTGIPYELTWTIDTSGEHFSVGVQHRRAAAALTHHLLSLGHRRFAVIAGLLARNDRAADRLLGVRDALSAHGIGLADRQVLQAPFSVSAGARAMATLLATADRFTALIAANDPLAIGALLECSRRGIAIPDDMSIVGFDDVDLAGELDPGLTTVRVPSADIGRAAGRRLLARLAGESVPRVQTMASPLIIRASSGRVPGSRP